MNADEVDWPLPFSGQRLGWADLPRHIRTRITELAGAQVTAETIATSGFSPGFVAVLELTDGSAVFVKAVSPRENPVAPDLARAEIRVAAELPPQIRAPKLLWSHDDGEWVIVGWEAIAGRTPARPWQRDQLQQVLAELDHLASLVLAPGHKLPATAAVLAPDFQGWRLLVARPDLHDRVRVELGLLGTWALNHLSDLIGWEQLAPEVLHGDHLVHGDMRSDNIMFDNHEQVWIIDWPHASVGAPWLDLAFMLPSVAAEGGGDPAELFAAQLVSQGVPHTHLQAALAGLAGYMVWNSLQAPPPGIPNLRSFQSAQARATLSWLHDLSDPLPNSEPIDPRQNLPGLIHEPVV